MSCVSDIRIMNSKASAFLPVAQKIRASDTKTAKATEWRLGEGAGPPPRAAPRLPCQALPGCSVADIALPSF